MNITIQNIALEYRNGVILQDSLTSHNNQELVAMFQAEAMRLGYMLDEALFKKLSKCSEDVISQLYKEIIPTLRLLTGTDRKWKIFYPNFPKQVLKASETELFMNAICHYWSLGRWMPEYKASRRLPALEKIKFTYLTEVTENDCLTVFTELLGSNVSLSEKAKSTLEWFVQNYGNQLTSCVPDVIPFKEQLCLYVRLCISHQLEIKPNILSTATDVLRVLTSLSGGDISLAENTKFRSWKRSERKFFATALEQVINSDDIARHGEKWKKAFHGLHIGDYQKLAPKTYQIASTLRNGKIITFQSKVEQAIRENDADTLFRLLSNRPGELARRMDHLMRILSESDTLKLITLFDSVADKIDSRVLIQLYGHMRGRSQDVAKRIVMPKGTQAKARILNKTLTAFPETYVDGVKSAVVKALLNKYAKLEPLGNVWIDPQLLKCPIPLAQRSASDSLRTVARGTRLPLTNKNTLRMFVWWIGQDIDLSCVLYDANFKHLDHISYTNLRIKGINSCHSGDITRAPGPIGAAEFIDIDIASARKHKVKYIAMNILDFTGIKFANYKDCFAGWMMRDYPNKNEVYDPKLVEQKLDLRTNTRLAAPVLFDLEAMEAIWLDLNGRVSGRLPNNVESNAATIEDLMQSALLLNNKLSLYELFDLHTKARGTRVHDRKHADTIFSLDEGITPFDIAKIASEFI